MATRSGAARGIDEQWLARLEQVARSTPGRTVVLRAASCGVRRRPARKTCAATAETEIVLEVADELVAPEASRARPTGDG